LESAALAKVKMNVNWLDVSLPTTCDISWTAPLEKQIVTRSVSFEVAPFFPYIATRLQPLAGGKRSATTGDDVTDIRILKGC